MDLRLAALSTVAILLVGVVLTALVVNWRRIFLPVVMLFAAWNWIKAVILIPARLSSFLYEATGAKTAEAHYHVARTAAALWEANTEFRPAAREIFRRVLVANGIRPTGALSADINPMDDPGSAAAVMGAALAVGASKGKPIESAACRCSHSSKDHDHRAGSVGGCHVCKCLVFDPVSPVSTIGEKARAK